MPNADPARAKDRTPTRSPDGAIYVAASWQPAHASTRIPVVDPATEQLLGEIPDADPVDVDTAVRAARTAFASPEWQARTVHDRAGLLVRLAEEIAARGEEMARTTTSENGSPISETAGAAAHAAALLRYFATLADDLARSEVRGFPAGGAHTVVRRAPVGVAAPIAPWNFPLILVTMKLAPALLAGCTVVIKPAAETPYNLAVLAAAVAASGIPPGVVNVVTGGAQTGHALVVHPGVDKVAFTGSTATGRAIARTCGELLLASRLLATCLRNTGQTCFAATRLLTPRDRYAEVLDLVTEVVRSARVGDPFDRDTVFGPVVSARQRDLVEDYLRIGVAEGARVTTGGGRPRQPDTGYYVEPTVFADVHPDMRIAQHEIFGPVLTVLPYDTEDDAIAIANNSRYGLGGVVFGADQHHALRVAARLHTGSVGLNFFATNPAAPFGGWKDSGLGVEYGPEGLAAYLKYQSIHQRDPG
jgi:aldehyde dehydrogenase (NAD+)